MITIITIYTLYHISEYTMIIVDIHIHIIITMTIVLPYSNRQDCDFAGASSGSWAALGALLATQGAGSVEALFHSGSVSGEHRPGKDWGKTSGNLGKPGNSREKRGKT